MASERELKLFPEAMERPRLLEERSIPLKEESKVETEKVEVVFVELWVIISVMMSETVAAAAIDEPVLKVIVLLPSELV